MWGGVKRGQGGSSGGQLLLHQAFGYFYEAERDGECPRHLPPSASHRPALGEGPAAREDLITASISAPVWFAAVRRS